MAGPRRNSLGAAGLLLLLCLGADAMPMLPRPLGSASDSPSAFLAAADPRQAAAVRHPSIILELHRGGLHVPAYWRSALALAVLSGLGAWSLHAGRPPTSEGSGKERPCRRQQAWLRAALLQILVMAGSSSFLLVEFPSHAGRAGYQLWQVGAVLSALPVGHGLSLPLYPWLSRVLPTSAICCGAALCRAAVLPAFAFGDSVCALLACRLFLGASCGFAQSAANAFLQQQKPAPGALAGFLQSQDRAVSLGSLLGCSLGAAFFMHSYAAPFWAASALNLALAAFMFSALRPLPTPPSAEGEADGGPSKGRQPQPATAALEHLPDCLLRRKPKDPPEAAAGPAAPPETTAPPIATATSDGSGGATGRSSTAALGDASGAGAPPLCAALPALALAAASICLATAATMFWEPLLSLYLQGLRPDVLLSPLDLGVAWSAWFACQAVLGLLAARLLAAGGLGPRLARGEGAQLLAAFGWLLLAAGAAAAAEAAPPGGSPLAIAGVALGLFGLLAGREAAVGVASMPWLLAAARPLGRAAVERVVPELWVLAFSLGEVFGPVVAGCLAASDGGRSGHLGANIVEVEKVNLATRGLSFLALAVSAAIVAAAALRSAYHHVAAWRLKDVQLLAAQSSPPACWASAL